MKRPPSLFSSQISRRLLVSNTNLWLDGVAVFPDDPSVTSCFLGLRYSRGVMSPGRHVRTRLYFTSESHVHSLLNVFRYGGLLDVRWFGTF